jgi:hypothetical protein
LFDHAPPIHDLGAQITPALVPGSLQLLQRDRDVRELGADRPAQELVLVEDPDLPQVGVPVRRLSPAAIS